MNNAKPFYQQKEANVKEAYAYHAMKTAKKTVICIIA